MPTSIHQKPKPRREPWHKLTFASLAAMLVLLSLGVFATPLLTGSNTPAHKTHILVLDRDRVNASADHAARETMTIPSDYLHFDATGAEDNSLDADGTEDNSADANRAQAPRQPGQDEPSPHATIAVFYPDFTPAGGYDDINLSTNLELRQQSIIVMSLAPRSNALDPAERTVKLYARFLEPSLDVTDSGLIVRAFADDSPFQGQTLAYSPPEGRQWAARCETLPASAAHGTRDIGGKGMGTKALGLVPSSSKLCFAALRRGNVDITLRFHDALLDHWVDIIQKTERLMQKFGANLP